MASIIRRLVMPVEVWVAARKLYVASWLDQSVEKGSEWALQADRTRLQNLPYKILSLSGLLGLCGPKTQSCSGIRS